MKNNFRFIFPRLIGATVVVGLASMIMFTLFKLLAGLVLIGGTVMLIKRIAARTNPQIGYGRYGQIAQSGIAPMGNYNPWTSPVTVSAGPVQQQTIVPVN